MTDANAVVERVRSLLPRIELRGVHFDEAQAARVEGTQPAQGERAPVTIQMELHTGPELAAYRFRIGVQRSDVSARVSVVAAYKIDSDEAWSDDDVRRTFGELVALPAAYPYAREKIQNLTLDMGVPPLVLGMIIPAAGLMGRQSDETDEAE